jgi:N-methylhydantoinase B/oxoprolinase/acetone carboxylase alpha subunit
MDSVDNLMTNTRNSPIEETELRFPLRCERYELRDAPAAAGEWRGGVGIVRETRFLVPGTYSCEGDRHYDPPVGIFGGQNGITAAVTRNPGEPDEASLPAKVTGIAFDANHVVRIESPNGAGYGDPLRRSPDAVRDDVRDEFIDADVALEAYGVVLGPGPLFEIDRSATDARRARPSEQILS